MTQEFRDKLVAEHMKEYGALDILVNKCVFISDSLFPKTRWRPRSGGTN